MRLEVHINGECFKQWGIVDISHQVQTIRRLHERRAELITYYLAVAKWVMDPILAKTKEKATYYVYFPSRAVDNEPETDLSNNKN